MIRFEKVSKVYGDVKTLSEISFQVEKGELLALIGPSGCGKTTTLRMINRLVEVSSGKIYIQGKDISQQNPVELRRSIGYVIQQVGLLPHMTVGKNIGLVPKLKGWREQDYSKRVDDLLDMVGLDPKVYRNRYPAELSGGQQQRVGVVRALAAEPPIILMDEPFSALDPISREQLQDDIGRIQKEIHKTIVFVTHDMDEALKIADRIAIMNQGKIVQLDTPKAILENPINDFVKGFIGEKRLKRKRLGQETTYTLEDIMTPLLTKISPYDLITNVLALAIDTHTELLIVTDDSNQILGTVTRAELERHASRTAEPVSVIMDTQVVALDCTYSWRKAAANFLDANLKSIAVMKQNQVVGYVTQQSMLKSLSELIPMSV